MKKNDLSNSSDRREFSKPEKAEKNIFDPLRQIAIQTDSSWQLHEPTRGETRIGTGTPHEIKKDSLLPRTIENLRAFCNSYGTEYNRALNKIADTHPQLEISLSGERLNAFGEARKRYIERVTSLEETKKVLDKFLTSTNEKISQLSNKIDEYTSEVDISCIKQEIIKLMKNQRELIRKHQSDSIDVIKEHQFEIQNLINNENESFKNFSVENYKSIDNALDRHREKMIPLLTENGKLRSSIETIGKDHSIDYKDANDKHFRNLSTLDGERRNLLESEEEIKRNINNIDDTTIPKEKIVKDMKTLLYKYENFYNKRIQAFTEYNENLHKVLEN